MAEMIVLHAKSGKPDTTITWLDSDGQPVPLDGVPVHATLVDEWGYAVVTVECSSADTAPNVTVPWSTVTLPAMGGMYRLLVVADPEGQPRYFQADDPPVVWVRVGPLVPPPLV